jgi:hypothetical protein
MRNPNETTKQEMIKILKSFPKGFPGIGIRDGNKQRLAEYIKRETGYSSFKPMPDPKNLEKNRRWCILKLKEKLDKFEKDPHVEKAISRCTVHWSAYEHKENRKFYTAFDVKNLKTTSRVIATSKTLKTTGSSELPKDIESSKVLKQVLEIKEDLWCEPSTDFILVQNAEFIQELMVLGIISVGVLVLYLIFSKK